MLEHFEVFTEQKKSFVYLMNHTRFHFRYNGEKGIDCTESYSGSHEILKSEMQ